MVQILHSDLLCHQLLDHMAPQYVQNDHILPRAPNFWPFTPLSAISSALLQELCPYLLLGTGLPTYVVYPSLIEL
jgi:hypothetical protein